MLNKSRYLHYTTAWNYVSDNRAKVWFIGKGLNSDKKNWVLVTERYYRTVVCACLVKSGI